MASKIIETTHDYEPVNKYIDEKARIKRTRSVWGYTKSLALFLIALGIFLILAAYAYHIFKKPHAFLKENPIVSEQIKKQIDQELDKKDKEIEKLEKQIENNPESQILKQEMEKLKEEKEELEKQLEKKSEKIVDGKKVVYDSSVTVFESTKQNNFEITTGFKWSTVDGLRYGERHNKSWCYLEKDGVAIKYYFDTPTTDQNVNLRELDLTRTQANEYKKYCKF